MQVKEIMSDDLKCCTPEMSLQDAAKMMVASDCGAVPVVEVADHTKAVGIITDRDIVCRAVAQGKDPATTPVADCMSAHVVTILPETSVEECCKIMEKTHVRRLLIADHDGRLCGIVTQADIALQLPEEKAAEVVRAISEPTEHSSTAG